MPARLSIRNYAAQRLAVCYVPDFLPRACFFTGQSESFLTVFAVPFR